LAALIEADLDFIALWRMNSLKLTGGREPWHAYFMAGATIKSRTGKHPAIASIHISISSWTLKQLYGLFEAP
jgi:hypothetical protein